MNQVLCPYCNRPTNLVGGNVIYPHRDDLELKKFWLCVPCEAYVGCHKDTEVPVGTPADEDTRFARKEAHFHFDKLWRPIGSPFYKQRNLAYRWLAAKMKLDRKSCHIGLFNVRRCEAVIELVTERLG